MSSARTLLGAGRSIVDGEFVMTAADFRSVADMIHADAGIALSDQKAPLVYSRLAKRLRALKLSSFAEYCSLVKSSAGVEERGNMLGALTTNVTRFFREPHHFEHLAKSVLPVALEQAKRGGRVRLWSSACSSGQEPFSMALTLLRLLPDAARYDIRILATDIDPNMIEEARTGRYLAELAADIPADLRRRWVLDCEDEPGTVEMAPVVRDLIEFRTLNLIKPWPMRGPFQAIFCRNVMIYFDLPTQSQVWARMAPLLGPEAALYIGHSERVAGPGADILRPDGITTYRRTEAGAKAAS